MAVDFANSDLKKDQGLKGEHQSVNMVDVNSLFEAVKSGKETRVKRVLEGIQQQSDVKGIIDYIDTKGTYGSKGAAPLHHAVARTHHGIVKLLIQNGADVNIKGGEAGNTPLHLANDKKMAELLIEGQADLNAKNQAGNTPLHNTLKIKRFGGHEIAQSLIKSGADVISEDKEGKTFINLLSDKIARLKRSLSPWKGSLFTNVLAVHKAVEEFRRRNEEENPEFKEGGAVKFKEGDGKIISTLAKHFKDGNVSKKDIDDTNNHIVNALRDGSLPDPEPKLSAVEKIAKAFKGKQSTIV